MVILSDFKELPPETQKMFYNFFPLLKNTPRSELPHPYPNVYKCWGVNVGNSREPHDIWFVDTDLSRNHTSQDNIKVDSYSAAQIYIWLIPPSFSNF